MRLDEQWKEIAGRLPEGWRTASLSLSVSEESDPNRAALILASLAPGRMGSSFRLQIQPDRNPAGIFGRLDAEGIRGLLTVSGSDAGPAEVVAAEPTRARAPLAGQWAEITAGLPADWSEIYAQVELASTDYVSRAALLMAPMNPARIGGPAVLRFRGASHSGYGTAAEMVQRCFERLDAESIGGTLRALRVLSHTGHAATQGPVWRVGGRSV